MNINIIYESKHNNGKQLLEEVTGDTIFIYVKGLEEAKKLLPQVYKLLDKAVKGGLIKKNTAARKKSRISRAANKSQKK